jgi:1-deoxyxylulose-5-phosphate synthase
MQISRREFLKHTSAAALLASASGFSFLPSTVRPRHATELIPLGNTGVRGSFLAFGTGVQAWNRQSALGRLGETASNDVLRYALERGINFFDLADAYGTHPIVEKALAPVPRDEYVLLTKILTGQGQPAAERPNGALEEIDRFRRELDTEMIDVCLLHLMTNDRWASEKARIMDHLSGLKERGVLRAVGVSCHDLGALKVAASHPWVEIIMARVNHRGGRDFHMDGTATQVADVLRAARANGKAVIGMKLYGQGRLDDPAEMDRSVRFVMQNDLIDSATIGMLKRAELDDNIQRIDRVLAA